MPEILDVISGRGGRSALPRHRHNLTPAQVDESQRWRLIAATAEVIAQQGYSRTTVDQISAAAGVSKKSFYKFFVDKEAALLAAYDAVGLVISTMSAAIPERPTDLAGLLRSVIEGYLHALQIAPAFTTMLLLRAPGATPATVERRIAGVDRYADSIAGFLAYGQQHGIAVADVSHPEIVAMLGGINELCIHQVQRHGVETLDELTDTLLVFALRVLAP